MFNRLEEIKELRKTRKLVAEKELNRLEKDYQFENRNEKIAQRMGNIKSKINQLEKDLENLTDLENKFKKKYETDPF
ncbi:MULTISPECIES: hypothetical protein [Psychrilyobacter]|uniref:Uncharacterized protein n=1 Tax=Psychrilyobacter piezotolerans TaxID=2293438 RepID=A0ABX9KEQ2_9FUSO|nr:MULTISPECIES: hypothetical protein [Psychrilyobacter]MCS5421309.1 hypothetical protein [Psychrilyobacter sp. S5]NDI78331.1 hypothetical protein [Psychrilyobacter piezotolerans]RDE59678.1 hypothetical protein DV867_12390 [Psychrilyobacter sp. S5]REI40054.1 hypothetical protein DYH56_12390 [Psychrilyobacter piezotolerans]